jgi:hypothetical protein
MWRHDPQPTAGTCQSTLGRVIEVIGQQRKMRYSPLTSGERFAAAAGAVESWPTAPTATVHPLRFGLHRASHRHTVQSTDTLPFLQTLRRHLPFRFALVWDRSRPHRTRAVQIRLAQPARTDRVEWLLASAAELDLGGCVRNHAEWKDLVDLAPGDRDALEVAVAEFRGRVSRRSWNHHHPRKEARE